MRHVTFYNLNTGALHAGGYSVLVSDDAAVELNTPAGHAAIDHPQGGLWDYSSHRVNLDLMKADDDAAATAWQAKKDQNRLARTAGGDPGEDPPAPVRTVANATHVVDYQPPSPSPDHEWNATTQRWQLSAVAQRAASEQMTRGRALAALEKKTPALLRAVALGKPGALAELTALDAQIAALESS